MNIPGFTAQASLHRSSRHYRSSGYGFSESGYAEGVQPAYIPGPATRHDCGICTGVCDKSAEICGAGVAAYVTGVCLGTLGLGCAGAAAAGAAVLANCAEVYAGCIGLCNVPGWVPVLGGNCCPKICGPPNPLEGSGSGCCDLGEACVDQHDPNSREGCCPSGQPVCSGHCCKKGDFCCGGNCCPTGFFCLESGECTDSPPFTTPGGGTPPPPPPNNCLFGGAPCGTKCCPPGLQCCGVFSGVADCRTSCIH